MKKSFSGGFLVITCWLFSLGLPVFGCSPRWVKTSSYPLYVMDEISQSESLRRSAENHLNRGEIQAAYQDVAQALSLDPSFSDAYFLMGKIYYQTKNLSAAGTCFRSCTQLDPQNARAYYFLGLIRRAQGNSAAAAEELRKAIGIVPLFEAARFLLGAIYYEQGQFRPAETEFAAAVSANPNNTTAKKYLSNIYFSNGRQAFSAGDYVKARDYFQKSIENNNLNTSARYYLGHTYMRIPHFSEAAAQFQEMLKKNPASREARQMLDAISRKWRPGAIPPALPGKAAASSGPTPAQSSLSNSYLNDGQQAFSSGYYLKARDFFLRSLEENHLNANARYYLGHTFMRIPHFSEASEQLNEMLKSNPASPEARQMLDSISRTWR